jgi:hypothetical protein
MTKPFEHQPQHVPEFHERPSADSWIERVRAADAVAEAQFQLGSDVTEYEESVSLALWAIAAELRALRIARRPGLGRK